MIPEQIGGEIGGEMTCNIKKTPAVSAGEEFDQTNDESGEYVTQ